MTWEQNLLGEAVSALEKPRLSAREEIRSFPRI